MDHKCKCCGAPLEGFETFCPECGRELPAAQPEGAYAEPVPEDPQDWFTVHDDDEVPQFRRSAVRRTAAPKQAAAAPVFRYEDAAPAPVDEAEYAEPTDADEDMPDGDLFAAEPYESPVVAPRAANPVRPQRTGTMHRSAGPAPRRPARPPQRRAPQKRAAEPMNGRSRTLLLAAMGVLVVVFVFLGAKMLFGGSDRATYPFTPVVDRYFAAVRTANANTYIATRPQAYTQYLTTGTGSSYENESEYRAETAASLHTRLAEYQAQFGTIREITYDLTGIVHYQHRCAALSEVLTGWYGFPENSVTDAYIANGSYTVRGDNGSADYNISELLLIQIGGEWYFSPNAGSYWRGE